MARFGVFLIILGVGSVILHQIGMEFILLGWVDHWGTTVGWVIRGAMVVIGLGLVVAEKGSARRG